MNEMRDHLKVRDMKAVAVYGLTNTASIEILKIDEQEERVYYCLRCGERGRVCFSKINSNSDGSLYFINRVWGTQVRIRLDECLRVA